MTFRKQHFDNKALCIHTVKYKSFGLSEIEFLKQQTFLKGTSLKVLFLEEILIIRKKKI